MLTVEAAGRCLVAEVMRSSRGASGKKGVSEGEYSHTGKNLVPDKSSLCPGDVKLKEVDTVVE